MNCWLAGECEGAYKRGEAPPCHKPDNRKERPMSMSAQEENQYHTRRVEL